MHMSRGFPFTSAEHEPHFPALQFHRTARSFGLLRLDLVHRVEHHHAFGHLGRVVAEFAALRVAAPDSKRRRCGISRLLAYRRSSFHLLDDLLELRRHLRNRRAGHFHSPSRPLRAMMLKVPNALSFSG